MILDFLQKLTVETSLVFKDLIALLFLIVYTIAFFVVQFYLIKAYVWVFKSISSFPIVKKTSKRILKKYYGNSSENI